MFRFLAFSLALLPLVFALACGSGLTLAPVVVDDGTKDHWDKGMQLWEDYGFRVTLGILANRFQDEPSRLPQLQEAFDAARENDDAAPARPLSPRSRSPRPNACRCEPGRRV